MTRLLVVNGALRGAHGETARALAHVVEHARSRGAGVDVLVLADLVEAPMSARDVVDRVRACDALIVATGTVWSSPSSVMTRFLEVLTPHELDAAFLGKPCAAVVTMDSVGGVEVGSRLLVALNLMGFSIPPCALVVVAKAARDDADVWSARDLPILVDNVLAAAHERAATAFRAWDVRRARALDGAYPAVGALDLGLGGNNGDDDDDDDER